MIASETDSGGAPTPRRWKRRLGILAVGTVAGFALCTLAANLFVRRVARPHLYAVGADVTAPFAIVLGASVYRDGTPLPNWPNG